MHDLDLHVNEAVVTQFGAASRAIMIKVTSRQKLPEAAAAGRKKQMLDEWEMGINFHLFIPVPNTQI